MLKKGAHKEIKASGKLTGSGDIKDSMASKAFSVMKKSNKSRAEGGWGGESWLGTKNDFWWVRSVNLSILSQGMV